jgi:hypothetical protein
MLQRRVRQPTHSRYSGSAPQPHLRELVAQSSHGRPEIDILNRLFCNLWPGVLRIGQQNVPLESVPFIIGHDRLMISAILINKKLLGLSIELLNRHMGGNEVKSFTVSLWGLSLSMRLGGIIERRGLNNF